MERINLNKKVLLISGGLLTLIIIISTIFIINKDSTNNEIVMEDNDNPINNSFLTLMLEQEDGSYQESTTNTWPSGNYAFNSELSRCENGGELRWDRENGIVELLSNKSDACYVYFDLYNVVQISNVEATKTYNSITVTVTTSRGENSVDKYYFSIDGGNSYQESTTPSYTFSGLSAGQSYSIRVYVRDTNGVDSNVYNITVTTLSSPIIANASGYYSETELTIDSISITSYYSIQNYYVIFKNNSKNITSDLIEFNEIPHNFISDYRSSTDDIICRGEDVTAEIYAIDVNGGKSNTIQISITSVSTAFPWVC